MQIAETFFNIVMIAGVIQGFVFSGYLFASKRSREISLRYLNLFVFFLTLHNLQIVLVENIFINVSYFIRHLLLPMYVLILPCFYTFLTHYLKTEKKVYSFIRITILLFTLEVLFRGFLYYFYFHQKKELYVLGKYAQIEEIINAVYSLFLFVKAAILLFKRKDLYAYVLSFDNVKWLKTFMYMGGIVLLFWVFAILINLDKVINPRIFIYYPLRFSSSILLYWVAYQGFYHYVLLAERIVIRKVMQQEPEKIIVNTTIKTNDKFDEIEKYINEKKMYLDADFSLKKLSEDLNMSTTTLSNVINQNSGYNFSDYVNQFRVKKAKKVLKKYDFETYTIDAIGLECGFNSKSTFYAVFKKFTDTTPSEFRKNYS